VDSRLAKIAAGEVDAGILAAAGMSRLGRLSEATELLDVDTFIPAVGQGCVAITVRERDANKRTMLAGLNHPESRTAAEAERAFLAVVEGDCRIPVAGHAVFLEHALQMTCWLATPDGKQVAKIVKEGFPSMAEELGREAGEELLEAGGAEILEIVRG
jgi:hydroxymethylbilane synthase